MAKKSLSYRPTTSSTNVMTVGSKSKSDPQHEMYEMKDDSVTATLLPSILVVDDDPSVSEILHDALSLWGYDVVLASNGREGLNVLASQKVDGILLDMDMSVMGGETMLDELRWLGYQTPVVVMSGGDVPTLKRLVKEGAQAFAIKPFSLSSLQKLCATVFENQDVALYACDHLPMA